jgi:hypothetical protein
MTLYDLCSDIIETDEDPYSAFDKIYKSISESKDIISKHFADIETEFQLELD